MATALFSALFRRAPPATTPNPFPYNGLTNPYTAKRVWPPDFSKLSSRYQFRLERRYRRRTKLKWARPVWTKSVRLAQWASILFVTVYGVFYMGVEETGIKGPEGQRGMTVFDGIRGRMKKEFGGFARGTEEKVEEG